MKFEYDKEIEYKECVAFVTDNGNIVMKNTDTGKFTIAICKNNSVHNDAMAGIKNAIHKFYPGDKLTITF